MAARFHHSGEGRDELTLISRPMRALGELLPDIAPTGPAPTDDPLPRTTVVAIVTVLPQSEEIEADIREAMEFCVSFLLEFIRAYRMSAPGSPVTFERLPSYCLIETRRIDGVGSEPVVATLLPTLAALSDVPSTITPAQFDRVTMTLARLLVGEPIFQSGEYKMRATGALRYGDYAEAILWVAIAVEVLLDHCLGLMMYEENVSAADAAKVWRKGGLETRVKTQYSSRLGGPWNREADLWRVSVAHRRHRIIHTAFRPNRAESTDALAAADGFGVYVLARLTERRNRYPWTTLWVVGRGGVARAGHYRGRFQQFAEQARAEEWTWLRQYREWRAEVDALI